MTGAVVLGAEATQVWGKAPASGRGAASRRRSLALILAAAVGAGASGVALGLLKQPDPQTQLDAFAFIAAAAIEAARHAVDRAQGAEAALAMAKTRIEEISASGAPQELADYDEAERLGVARFIKDSTAYFGDERRHLMAAIVRESRRNRLDPLLVAAVIQVESRFDPFAVSGVGACGLMQLMPPTAQGLLNKDDGKLRPAQLFNPVLNIELGTMYLAQQMDRFGGDLTQALIAYNAGPTVARTLRRGSPAWKRLHAYPKAVLAAYKALLKPPEQVAAR
jgi:soluble lytic murein transglycosylase